MESSMSDETLVMTVPEAGWRYFKLKKDAAYKAAREGLIPTIRIGGAVRVPIAPLEKMIAEACEEFSK
jgi:hypothetical protein